MANLEVLFNDPGMQDKVQHVATFTDAVVLIRAEQRLYTHAFVTEAGRTVLVADREIGSNAWVFKIPNLTHLRPATLSDDRRYRLDANPAVTYTIEELEMGSAELSPLANLRAVLDLEVGHTHKLRHTVLTRVR